MNLIYFPELFFLIFFMVSFFCLFLRTSTFTFQTPPYVEIWDGETTSDYDANINTTSSKELTDRPDTDQSVTEIQEL